MWAAAEARLMVLSRGLDRLLQQRQWAQAEVDDMQKQILIVALAAGVFAVAAGVLGLTWLAGAAAVPMLILLILTPWMRGPQDEPRPEGTRRKG